MLRIIDNKRIDLTDEEWNLYENICKSYDVEARGVLGKELFIDLFETDENGIIVFLKPPKNLTSMEVYMFLVSTMIHQHLGVSCKFIDQKIGELNKHVERAEKILDDLEKRSSPTPG